jgi:prepilin signal peptidase PulO-like enzyme (type II secretory pathway)
MTYVLLVALGLCFGSFVEAWTWRVREQDKETTSTKHRPSSKKHPKNDDLSIVKGRSMCADCKHTLAWYDLLPLVSWLSLKGRCRYCRRPIGWQAPVLEVGMATAFVFSYHFWPLPLHSSAILDGYVVFALWLVALIVLVALLVYDLRWMLLPNRMVAILCGITALYAALRLSSSPHLLHDLVMLLLALLFLPGLFWLLYQVSAGRWIGGGDVKLAVPLSLLVARPELAFLVLFLASVGGSVIGVPLMMISKQGRGMKLPFGPFLITGTVVAVLFGTSMITWYKRLLLI